MKTNIYKGSLIVKENETLTVNYTEITGNVDVCENATFDAPELQAVGGYVDVYTNATFDAPALQAVGGNVYVCENATFDAPTLQAVGGYVNVCENATFDAPTLQAVGGNVYVGTNATFDAPTLQAVGGDVYVCENATFDAPALQTVGGDVYVRKNATFDAPTLQAVGDYVYVGTNATFDAPELQAVGGDVNVYTNATFLGKPLETNAVNARSICQKALFDGFERLGFVFFDDILLRCVSHKGNVWRTKKLTTDEIVYIVSDGAGNYAHGSTLSEAKEDLIYKCTDRKKSDYEQLTLNDTLTHEDAIKCYRVITGACSAGTRYFVEEKLNGDKKDKYTIAEIIKLTNGEWGNKTFKEFFV